MASVKFEKNSTEWRMFGEFWKLCKMYWNPDANEDLYWDRVDADTYDFALEFRETPMSKELAETLRRACANKIMTGRRESTDFSVRSVNYQVFVEFWAISQKYWIPEDDEEYWNDLFRDACEFRIKYQKQVSLAYYLAFMFPDFFDAIWRRKNQPEEELEEKEELAETA